MPRGKEVKEDVCPNVSSNSELLKTIYDLEELDYKSIKSSRKITATMR